MRYFKDLLLFNMWFMFGETVGIPINSTVGREVGTSVAEWIYRIKSEILSSRGYQDQEKLFDEISGEESRDTIPLN